VSWAPEGARIRAAVFSPDGKTLITQAFGPPQAKARDFNRVKAVIAHWEVGTGKRLDQVEFDITREFSTYAILSADGKYFVSNMREKKVELREAATGKQLLQLDGGLHHWDPIQLSADNRLLVLLGEDGNLRVYDREAGKELRRILRKEKGPVSGFQSPALSPDGKLLAASSRSTLSVWDTANGELKQEFPDCRGAAAFSADGKYLASGNRQGIRLWETLSFKEVRRFEDPRVDIRGLAFSADGKFIASASDFTVGVWEVATGKQVNRLQAHDSVIYSLAFTPSSDGVVSGSDDGTAIVWDLDTMKPRHILSGHYRVAGSVECSPDGKMLATGEGYPSGYGNNEAQIRLWSLADGTLVRQFTGHLHSVHRLAFSPDGTRLASAGYDARFRVWDPATGKRLFQIRGNEGTRTLAYSPDGKMLVLGTSWGDLSLVQAENGQKVRDLGTPQGDYRRRVMHAAFSGDGMTVVSLEQEENRGVPKIRLWETESGREIRSVPIPGSCPYSDDFLAARAVSPDGTIAATATDRGPEPAIQVWDLSTGKLMTQLRGHALFATVAAYSPDGKLMASGSRDTTVLVWDVEQIRMRQYWSELLSGTADAKTSKALTTNSIRAAAFLKERLTRSAEVETAARRLIAELDDNQFAVREKASRELGRLAPAAEAILRRAVEESKSAEARQRLQAVLAGLKNPDKVEPALGPEHVRMAVTLLENLNSPESRRAIEDVARAPDNTAATREARAALERLKKSAKDR
jgi:WD40 repeat protein